LVLDHARDYVRGVRRGCIVVIDPNWLLWSRALLDYTRAATAWLQTRVRRAGMTDKSRQRPHAIARKIGYSITGLAFALTVGPVFVIGVYTILTSLVSL
jgi:hypothetical protein